MEQKSSVYSLILVLRKVTVFMHGNLLHATVQMGVIIFKVLIFINHKVQYHMLTPSKSTLLSRLCIDSLTVIWMPVIHFRIKMFPFMKESVSVHHPIIWTGLIDFIPMFLSIEMKAHVVFNSLI